MVIAKETHCRLVLQHMKEHGTIHHFEAEELYGCTRLAARIKDLRNRGVAIDTELVPGKNRNGGSTRYAVYRLREVNEA